MIYLDHISKNYPNSSQPALSGVSLTVQIGEIFGVIGKSGAGKSTLIRCVNLLERPTTGKVWLASQELTALKEQEVRLARRQCGMIFQHFNLLSAHTVFDNIALPLVCAGEPKATIKARVNELLALVDLQDKQNQYPAQLSGGQKQRVAIARALSSRPKVLLCDEATSALDPQTTQTILQLLRDINQRLGLTILLITHEMTVVKQICDRVALLHQGKLIETHATFDFFTHQTTAFGKQFVASALVPELPATLRAQLSPTPLPAHLPLVRLLFQGVAASEPLIARVVRDLGVNVNILQGNIESLGKKMIGVLVIELDATETQLLQVCNFLQQQQVLTEVIGYVPRSFS